jgi:hypothetical protein
VGGLMASVSGALNRMLKKPPNFLPLQAPNFK